LGTLILARHSTTEASAAGRNLGRSSDPPLTAAGLELARDLGVTLRAELSRLPHDDLRLVTSPARRCRETIAAVAAALEVEVPRVETDAGLLEFDYGAWDGLTPEECEARDPEVRAAWVADPYATRCPGGESGADVAARCLPVLDAIEAWAREDRARCAIVVAHNHVNRIRLCRLLGYPMREYRDRVVQDPAAYSMLGIGPGPIAIRRINAPAATTSAASGEA
jgi:probable phosphoglycerate mutase